MRTTVAGKAPQLVPTILPLTDEQRGDLGETRATHVLLLLDRVEQIEVAVFGTATELDTWVRRAGRAAAGMFKDEKRSGPVRVLADELVRAYAAPDEDLALALADRLVTALDMAGLAVVDRRKDENDKAPEAPAPPMIHAGFPVPRELVPGQVVQRWTDKVRGRRVAVDLPCCERRVILPAEVRGEDEVVCPQDGLKFAVRLADDGDGGFWAYVTVVEPVILAKARRRRSPAR
ncbi:hypothetical protein GCM10023194_81010 [Planotetraspora phitsanulokensis]|uniref:Uncharacterized protein n=1 Tax=Planotetraspora phitsanulokensis TaxID=575192 RepID=A0A8J3UDI2_9ACTN|nr:hypothetical protein [Planotetraspora phitsanulokensis]GII42857.1 hypothetical protein Pph01_78600 [Planotetraspora phitsanulokensis]